ncbi:carboxypeptidase regulatory-like domain-containing protein [Corallincola holothuriorum]|uniref:Carboxypeptidase regulatory-like domain-containing protein n=1 Tax=Corallincola holothuriorum TaxID=2282215 RepID=A0A368NJW6_9GAMM|nr:carboxypeptidase-like regulatory domain-containing protein [Corallincola holothuriorum]RCU50897.1 carboxypeptidase regulatory-like domain-containing protein [Corallincola holothuriorum]
MAVNPTLFTPLRLSFAGVFVLLLFCFSTMVEGDMFGLFKTYDVHLCPEVKGRLTLKGEPVAGVTITRSLTFWDEAPRVDTTVSDENGHFTFAAVNIRSKKPGDMFVQEYTKQEVFAEQNGQKFKLWLSILYGYKERPEYSRKLAMLDCDLKNKVAKFEFKNDQDTDPDSNLSAVGICRWKEDFKIFEQYDYTY